MAPVVGAASLNGSRSPVVVAHDNGRRVDCSLVRYQHSCADELYAPVAPGETVVVEAKRDCTDHAVSQDDKLSGLDSATRNLLSGPLDVAQMVDRKFTYVTKSAEGSLPARRLER